jgi:hypothetical protein
LGRETESRKCVDENNGLEQDEEESDSEDRDCRGRRY